MEELSQLVDQFSEESDLQSEYLATLHELNFRLSYEADEWGESRETLSAMGLEMRCGSCRMLTVLYGIHAISHTVFVKTVTLNRRYRK